MRSVMRRARAASRAGSAPGMASSRCSSQGSSGLGAGAEGQVRSPARRNQMASKVEPADSSGPMIWMGAWRDSGAKRVSAAMRSSASRAAVKGTRGAVEVEGGEFVEGALPLAAGLELDAVESRRDGPAGGFEEIRGWWRPTRRGCARGGEVAMRRRAARARR